MTAASLRVQRSLQGLRDDRTDQTAPAQESTAADAASGLAAEATQQEVARVHPCRGRGTLHAAALRNLRQLLLSGAGRLSFLPVIGAPIRRRAAPRYAARRDDRAGTERCLFPRADALA